MEFDQLETFLVVASKLGFHRAAAVLHVSQPAVSARIKALEHSLGVRLFERTPKELTLTQAGRVLQPHAERLLTKASEARKAMEKLHTVHGGSLQIAAAFSISAYFLPDVLKRFQRAQPDVTVTIRSGHSKEVLEMVLSGKADIGLARSLQHPEIETLSLHDDPLMLVASPAQAPKTRRARLEEVASWPLIFFDHGGSDWTLAHGLFRSHGQVPNIAFEVDSIETAKRMVERGVGFAFLPHLAVGRELRRGRLSAIKIQDVEPVHRSLDVIHLRDHRLRSQALAFLQSVRETVSEVYAFSATAKSPKQTIAKQTIAKQAIA